MHILVTFANRHGSTRSIAETITAELEASGHTVALAEAAYANTLDRCDAVVVGSGIYLGHWLKPVREFLTGNREQLAGKPVRPFSSGPLGNQVIAAPSEIDALAEELSVQGHAVFGGALDVNRLGMGERLITKVVRAPHGDFRNWPAIRAWSHQIGQALNTMEPKHAGVPPQEAM